MCEICGHPSPDTNNIDDLLEAYERQQREVYINRTIPAIDKLEGIAYDLADAYEMEYRANPTYENEERMRYWRYMGAKHWSSKADGTYYEGPNTECKNRKKEYEEFIRKHREATKTTNKKHLQKKRIPTNEEIDAFIFIGLTGSMIAYPILMFIFLMVVVGPKG